MKMVKRYAIPAVISLHHCLNALFFVLPKLSKNKDKYPLKERYYKVSKIVRGISKALRVDFYVEGRENLPKENGYCLVPNHLSGYDALAFLCVMDEPTTFVSKLENKSHKTLDNAVKALNGEFMDRSDLRQSLKVMKHVEDSLKEKNLNWVIFAEGTRNKDPMKTIKEMHHGSFKAAMRAGAPIVPVALIGTERALKCDPILNRYPVHISFLKPLYKEDYEGMTTEQVAEIVESMVQKELSFKLRNKDNESMIKDNKNIYRFNQIMK